MNQQPTPSMIRDPQIVKQKACIQCRTRKVKCDKGTPCTNCRQWSIECAYPSPIRMCRRPKKRRAVDDQGPCLEENDTIDTTTSANNALAEVPSALQGRVNRIERTLEQLTQLVEYQSRHVHHNQGGSQLQHLRGGLIASSDDSSRLSMIENRVEGLMAQMTSSLESAPGVFDNLNTETPFQLPFLFPTLNGRRNQPFSSLGSFPFRDQTLQLARTFPSFAQAQTCWRVFKNHVDPLVKVVHNPSMERIILKSLKHPSSLRISEEVLLHAMYFASLSTMPEEAVQKCFRTTKVDMFVYLCGNVERALMEADFLMTDNLYTLQAFVMFLTLRRFNNEQKMVCALIGAARRLSDPPGTRIESVFEQEMRNRVWWQLWFLEKRVSQDYDRLAWGMAAVDRSLPLNINDVDLDPEMITVPPAQAGWTDMTFALIRFELAKTSFAIEDGHTSFIRKENLLTECSYRIESLYLNYCDSNNMHNTEESICWLVRHTTQVFLHELWFKLYGQLEYAPVESLAYQATRDRLFRTAIEMLDSPRLYRIHPQAEKWRWALDSYFQHLPLTLLLLEMIRRLDGEEDLDHVWYILETYITKWDASILEMKPGNDHDIIRLMDQARQQWGRRLELKERQADEILASVPGSIDGGLYASHGFVDSGLLDPSTITELIDGTLTHVTLDSLSDVNHYEDLPSDWVGDISSANLGVLPGQHNR